ncbi:MAG: DUF4041 domain-containing protein [Emcibacter sp.]|nr:DUF4041 domain-containing protein [Emcibacter sp.]
MEVLILLLILFLLPIVLGIFVFKYRKRANSLEKKYSSIIDIDVATEKLLRDKEIILSEVDNLRDSYKDKKIIYDNLIKEAAIFNEEIQLAELGFYKPHYDFDTSEDYKKKMDNIKIQQKYMVTEKTAIYSNTQWTVQGSRAKGKTMANRAIRLTARAFNKECDSAVAKVRWNNIKRLEVQIEKAFYGINQLNKSQDIEIDECYLNLKIEELRIAHEYVDKKHQEKEVQAEIKRQMREEMRFEKEVEKAISDELKYENLLERAKVDISKSTGNQLNKLNAKIAKLEEDLAAAHEKSERAKSMAQQTKSGHVYVISNIGSFGEGIYKIGMTRRLDPIDRVKELGDASVPFIFDLHAMIYSEDAPALENSLHKAFENFRLNLVNTRKEFFKIALDDIVEEVRKVSPEAEFIKSAEARHFTETLSILEHREKLADRQNAINQYPESL